MDKENSKLLKFLEKLPFNYFWDEPKTMYLKHCTSGEILSLDKLIEQVRTLEMYDDAFKCYCWNNKGIFGIDQRYSMTKDPIYKLL